MSNRKRHLLSNRLWSMIKNHTSGNITLENDWLGKTYEVNRYGIVVRHANLEFLNRVRQQIIEKLIADGWKAEETHSIVFLTHADTPAYASFNKSYVDQSGDRPTFRIGIGA